MWKKNKSHVTPLKRPWSRREARYVCLFKPLQRWFPSRWANFTFGVPRDDIDPEWYLTLVPESCNPSIWLNKRKNLYTLRVPKDFEEDVKRRLHRRGFRYYGSFNVWIRGIGFKME